MSEKQKKDRSAYDDARSMKLDNATGNKRKQFDGLAFFPPPNNEKWSEETDTLCDPRLKTKPWQGLDILQLPPTPSLALVLRFREIPQK